LTKNGNPVAKLRVNYERLKVEPDVAAQQVDTSVLSTDALDSSTSRMVSSTSQLVDDINLSAKVGQSVCGDVKEVALYVSPLAQALGSLDQIIKIIDGIAEVNIFFSASVNMLILTDNYRSTQFVKSLGTHCRPSIP
jgi:hypothetical protein